MYIYKLCPQVKPSVHNITCMCVFWADHSVLDNWLLFSKTLEYKNKLDKFINIMLNGK